MQNLTMKTPHNEELEKLVLGTIILDSTAFYKVSPIISKETFNNRKHQTVFMAIQALNRSGQPIDLVTVYEWLVSKGLSSQVQADYLSEMTNRVASSANLEAHAAMLFSYYVRRKLISTSQVIWRAAHDLSQDVMSTLEKAKSDLFSKTVTASNNAKSVGYHVDQIIKKSKEANGRYTEVTGVPSGFETLDKWTGGFLPGDLYIFAARPSMGKTTFVINAMVNAVKKFGKKILFFSGEMDGGKITSIIMAKETGIPIKHIKQNRVADWRIVLDELGGNLSDNLIIDDTPAPSLMHVESKAVSLAEQHDIHMIVVDYIQLMKVNGIVDKKVAVGLISNGLKELARRLEVPVIALSQLSRECDKRTDSRPIMSDLRESGEIEQDADMIAFLYRPEYYGEVIKRGGVPVNTEGLTEVIIRKNRQGALGSVMTHLEKTIGRFSSYNTDFQQTIPLEDYDMSITQPKEIESTNYITPVDDQGDDLPF